MFRCTAEQDAFRHVLEADKNMLRRAVLRVRADVTSAKIRTEIRNRTASAADFLRRLLLVLARLLRPCVRCFEVRIPPFPQRNPTNCLLEPWTQRQRNNQPHLLAHAFSIFHTRESERSAPDSIWKLAITKTSFRKSCRSITPCRLINESLSFGNGNRAIHW